MINRKVENLFSQGKLPHKVIEFSFKGVQSACLCRFLEKIYNVFITY